jgi:hypothetical protein
MKTHVMWLGAQAQQQPRREAAPRGQVVRRHLADLATAGTTINARHGSSAGCT